MSLPMILLGLLDQPRTGYDLKQLFETTVGHFWSANTNQIYPALKRLEHDGLVSLRTRPSPIGPERREYKRTTAGRRALLSWIEDDPRPPRPHIPYLAQVFFLKEHDAHAEAAFRMLRTKLAAEYHVLVEIEKRWLEECAGPVEAQSDEDFYPFLSLRHGLLRREGLVRWADESLELIEVRRRNQQRLEPADPPRWLAATRPLTVATGGDA